ncbi:MAG: LolA family protein [Planctomycetota bacterium]|jgi:outer membrane lipoprotein-sorting protein
MKSASEIKRLARQMRITPGAEADERILAFAEATLAKSTKARSEAAGSDHFTRRRIMTSKTAKLGAAAVIVIAVLIGIYHLGRSIEMTGVAFGDVLEYIRMAQTVKCTIAVERDGEEPFVMQYMLTEPNRMRIEASDGSITIVDTYQGKCITLKLAEKKAFIMATKTAPKYILNIYPQLKAELLKNFPDGSEQNIGQAEIDGRKVVGFHVKYDAAELTVWADADNGAPVRVESLGPVRSETASDPEGLTVRTTLSNLVYGEKLDDTLFSLVVPEGYSVEQVSTPASPVQEQVMRSLSARLMLRLAKACLDYARAHNDQWPDNLTVAVEFTGDDELLGLKDPERELGCVYIKPARTDPRLVLLYQAYDEWPEGGINVSFVDCHTTIIQAETTFKEHLQFTLGQRGRQDQEPD